MRYAKKRYEEIYRRDVQRVTTIKGASKLANVHPNTIYHHIMMDNIHAEIVHKMYLVSVQSVIDFYQLKDEE